MTTATLADIQEAANVAVYTYVDEVIPAGHFGAAAKIDGVTTVYLLEGAKNDSGAIAKGHVRIHQKKGGVFEPQAYLGSHLFEGTYMGPVDDYAEAFANMV